MVAGPEVGQGPKGETVGMVWLEEVFQETIPFWNLLWKEDERILWVTNQKNDDVGPYK